MNNLIMLIGLPASGKSTYAAEKNKEGYLVFSSDNIRLKHNIAGYSKEENAKVFEILHEEIREALFTGKNCIYDATNMSRKQRMYFLNSLGKQGINIHKKCILFLVSVEECKRRNNERTDTAKVPEDTYDRMLKQFQCPYYYEGWDEIEVKLPNDFKNTELITEEKLYAFEQNNSHHQHNLGEHLARAMHYTMRTYPTEYMLHEAAAYHDIGKMWTKTYTNSKGEATEEAHYYGHENYGAYIYLTENYDVYDKQYIYDMNDYLYCACLINWHMKPYTAWKDSEKARKRDRKIIGEEMYQDIVRLHEADIAAH